MAPVDPAVLKARQLREAKLAQREIDGTLPEYGYVNADGDLVPDPIPIAPPIGYIQQPSLVDQVLEKLNARARMIAEDEEVDDLEDLNDFGPDDDDFPASPHELSMAEEFPELPRTPPVPPEPAPAAPQPPIAEEPRAPAPQPAPTSASS